MPTEDRIHAFDHLKAAAIVAVVFTHGGPDTWFAEGDPLIWFLTKRWTVFHVASFMFVSGFLYARSEPIAPASVGARLLRIVLPYLVWSTVAHAAGVTEAAGPGDVAWQLLTGSTVGVYYYVPVICGCILLMWPLSWLGRRGAAVLWIVYTLYSVVAVAWPGWRTSNTLFWMMRDPLQLYSFGFFLSGWVIALWRQELARLFLGRERLLAAGAALLLVFGLAAVCDVLPFSLGHFDRALYTFGVVGSCFVLLQDRPAGRVTRFLADATLGMYLSHFVFILLLRPLVAPLSEGPRVALLVAAGLVGSAGICWAARWALGQERAARWVGA